MFSAETSRFLTDLAATNTRDWFTASRDRYDAHVAGPAKAFCAGFEAAMSRRTDAPVTGKIWRLNRDLRFARDKTPYNAHVHIGFAEPGSPMIWMVGLETDRLVIGYGAFAFDGATVDRFRVAVDGPAGTTLDGILNDLRALGLRVDPPALKRVPAPYTADHPRAVLLRHKSLAVWNDGLPLQAAYGQDAPTRLASEMQVFDPLRAWVLDALG
ncbi:MAG: DUF2461 domain-containing protein [Rhodobacter sp.]|nr:DUF2461 domain-containing protein [Paracoccaceae bacterium]MCC0077452.1 DUF2461 domain-containing protein [Rhodobacter sp.]